MHTLQGFLCISKYADNAASGIAPIGELSKYSSSFSKDIKFFHNDIRPEATIHLFSSLLEGNTSYVEPVSDQLSYMQRIGEWLIANAETGVTPSSQTEFLSLLDLDFKDLPGVFQIGQIIEFRGFFYPSYVEYSQDGWTFKLWLNDDAFKSQYVPFEILPIMPVEVVDSLTQGRTEVEALLNALTPTTLMDKARDVEGVLPSTVTRSLTVEWVDSADSSLKLPISFAVVIYGRGGDNIDSIKQAIGDYILANSSFDRSVWVKILPDIFNPNEMLVIPHWDTVLDAYDPLSDDIYSSTIKPDAIFRTATNNIPLLSTDHILKSVVLVPTVWRGILCSVVPNEPLLGDPLMTFEDVYPDYFVCEIGGDAFHRMTEVTRILTNTLMTLLTVAENYNDYTILPTGVSRVKRGDREFLAIDLRDYMIYVQTKRNYNAG